MHNESGTRKTIWEINFFNEADKRNLVWGALRSRLVSRPRISSKIVFDQCGFHPLSLLLIFLID
ncbi:MAG: hypothetical protein DMG06_26455 [Acidobacteria bacterium]|nr:MAG: hypothetical protein DMG06_26455 [Acidobacteriota bacterium]